MKNLIFRVILLFIIVIIVPSCATILSGTKQTVRINSSPSGAKVVVNGKDMGYTTPCSIELDRKVKPSQYNNRNEYHYNFIKEGYSSTEFIDYRRINKKMYWACVLYPILIISLPVDYISGAAYQYNDNLSVSLAPEQNQNDNIVEMNNISQLDKQAPQIKILSPDLTRGFKPTVDQPICKISGLAVDESGLSEISINGVPVRFGFDGSFTYEMQMEEGSNKITVIAKDKKMNTAAETFYIDYQPIRDVAITKSNEVELKGQYFALIIGIEDYQDPAFNDLDEPLNDAQKLQNTLVSSYLFDSQNIIMLQNASRDQITEVLENYFNKLNVNDNLLIFYAGHGYWDDKFKQGYWLPADAKYNNRGTWLSNSTIRDYMRAISCRHSLLITDACFAGGIFKSREAFPDASKAINELYDLPSRKAMTSGALNQVPDKSVFLQYLIKRLEDNLEKYLPAEQLFASLKMAVINNSPEEQVPQFGEVKETGDEGGDFIFIRK